ncbi:unnamed protein product [Oikopleura dioica]|uniref:Uncharacterized protein n=1 Tax=Oikopleura dioica TaxID=34765 RepID=E4XJN5_OIKDI|nr:unnamed protein product [Oikopleura dioica]
MELEETLDKRGDFVFRSKHRRLCAPPFCAHDNNQFICTWTPGALGGKRRVLSRARVKIGYLAALAFLFLFPWSQMN